MVAHEDAILVFAKPPLPGKVKTRLSPVLTPEAAADLYRCMLLDTLSKVASLATMDRFLFYAGDEESAEYFRGIAPTMGIYSQKGSTLGDRMEQAFRQVFAKGYKRVAIIGTDSPDLPSAIIESSFEILEKGTVEVVFGPAEDGGYYLLAMKRVHPELFREIPWSSGSVLEDSLIRCAAAGLMVELLPLWYDLDTIEDLQRPGLLGAANNAPLTRHFIQTRC